MTRALLLLLAAAAVLAAALALSLYSPYQGFQREVVLEIPHGTSTRATAAALASSGVIRSPWQFLAARVLRPRARLQAGEYRFDKPASVWQVFDRLVRGDVIYYEISIPEGYNLYEVSEAVAQLGFISAKEFLAAAKDPSLVSDLAPNAPNLEGYLFPSTYRVVRQTTAQQLCRRMTETFRKQWQLLGIQAPVHETVTLASLVEKETSIPEERPLVASVYRNRLERGMKLECDPTTVYASLLSGKWRGTIYRSDLDRDHPYNTYQRAGLPPGPIANPGLASLKAALQPVRTDYLFFVARPDSTGAHNFSTSYSGHEKAVAEYKRGEHKKDGQTRNPAPVGRPKRQISNH